MAGSIAHPMTQQMIQYGIFKVSYSAARTEWEGTGSRGRGVAGDQRVCEMANETS